MVSLFIIILTLIIIVNLTQFYRTSTKKICQSGSDWEIGMLRLEKMTNGATLLKHKGNDIQFISSKDYKYPEKTYILKVYKGNMLRITGSDGGHIPLFVNQKFINLNLDNDILRISVTDKQGKKWQHYIKFKKVKTT